MNILLLGSFGFIGTNIIKYIDQHFYAINVVAFDRFPEHMDHIAFKSVVKVYSGDFSNEVLLEEVFRDNKIDLVIHSLSASVPSSSLDNKFDIRFNVLPTIGLLNQMVKHDVKRIVFISSGGAIYGDHYINQVGHVEDEVLFPKSSYGISKLVVEKYLYLYAVHYGVQSLILRLSNPFGPYHYSQKQGIINIAMECALERRPFEIWGNGNGKKDYIFIEDFCAIVMMLIEKWNIEYTVLNVGSGNLLSVNDIVEYIRETVSPDFECIYKDANALDVLEFKLDFTALKKYIGEYHFTSIIEGIERTKKWYLNNKR